MIQQNLVMKKILSILILTLSCITGLQAQELAVQSFTLAETDLTANTPGTMVQDQNGNVCALIKVETTQKGFTFDVGVLGVMSVVEQPGEIWVYVPFGVRKITVQHPQLGVLRDYQIPCAIEKGRTYIMKLTTGTVRTIVDYAPSKQFLQIQLNPADAILEINGKIKVADNGVYQELLPFGRYQYKAYGPDYHDLVGVVEVSDPDNAHKLNLTLRAAFGRLSVLERSQPDLAGASVYVDEKYIGKVPVRDFKIASGSHRVRILKEMYEPYNQTFTISDEQNLQMTPTLVPDFAEVTLSTVEGAEILVNGEYKGTRKWSGKLSNGSYIFETRMQGHIPYKMSYDVSRNDQGKTITIQGPTPIYGSLAISSTPSNAKITINGKSVGETPKYISRQVIGKYTVTAEMDGYQKQTKTVEVAEGAEASLSFELKKQETAVAVAPASGSGTSSGTGDFVLKVKGVEYPMVFVEGGTFRMGSDDSEAYGDEKPVHNVTLSSYCIGKYEVTQELWEAVMGSNPSSFKGSRRPVEKVSWEDCQEFIRKLNNLTGKNFKLPTEAQWEFAARGGKKSRGYKYSGSNTIGDVAWYTDNSGSKTHDVGTKAPNELGLYDMTGNVYEWCSDWYGSYGSSSQTNPTGPSSGSSRVHRGGGWSSGAWSCRVSYRSSYSPVYRNCDLGFRLCL